MLDRRRDVYGTKPNFKGNNNLRWSPAKLAMPEYSAALLSITLLS